MKFHFSFQHEGTYATSSSTIRGVQNVPNQQCRDFHPTWKFRAGTVPRLPAGRWCWWPTMVLVGKLRSTSSIHNDGAATAFWRQSPKPWWEHARSTRHDSTDRGKSGTRLLSIEGEIGSGGNVGAVSSRNQTKFPCTVLINWVGQEQYRFSLSLVSKIQGYNV